MVERNEQFFINNLRQQGHKLTQPRRALIEILLAACTPLTVPELHQRALQHIPNIGLVTIYRTMELFTELDLIRPVHLVEGQQAYALATPGHTHHLVCTRCRRVVEIKGCNLDTFIERVADQTGYAVTGHWLELEGLCAECQQKLLGEEALL